MKKLLYFMMIVIFSAGLTFNAVADSGGIVPDPDIYKEQHQSSPNNAVQEEPENNEVQEEPENNEIQEEPENNEVQEEAEVETVRPPKDRVKLNVSELSKYTKDYHHPEGYYHYDYEDRRLTVCVNRMELSGKNDSLTIEIPKGILSLYFTDLSFSSEGATCSCGKSCTICAKNRSYARVEIYITGENYIYPASGSLFYNASDSLFLCGNDVLTVSGEESSTHIEDLTLRSWGPDVIFLTPAIFKDINIRGGEVVQPWDLEEYKEKKETEQKTLVMETIHQNKNGLIIGATAVSTVGTVLTTLAVKRKHKGA